MPSSTNGATFWRHDRRRPSARRIDARNSASGRRARARRAARRRAGSRGRRPRPSAPTRSCGPPRSTNTSSSDVSRGRQAVQRQAEVGDDVAEQRRGRRRRRSSTSTSPSTATAAAAGAGERGRRARRRAAPTSTVDPARCARAASRSAPATTSRPPSIITTWSHTCCTSSSRWVAISTEMPNVPSRATSASISSRPERVEAGGRLVEQHQLGVADERLGQLRALAHAGGEPADRAEPGLVETDQVEHVRRPLAGGAGRAARSARRTSRRRRPRSGRAAGSRARACSRAATAHADRVVGDAMPPTSTVPAVGWARPSRRRNNVVLPAPLAPTRPMRPARHVDRQLVERGDAGSAWSAGRGG